MIQGALSTQCNVSVSTAMSIFDKQIMPIITYGSTFWGISNDCNKLYILNIPKSAKSPKELANIS